MRDMKEFFQFAQISKSLQRRLIDYFNATWSKRKGMQQVDSTLQTFPANLRGEIFQHLHREFINLPVFQYTSPACRNFLALRVQRMFFTPDEILVYEGDSLGHIYLVISGSMEVSRDGQICAIFGKGDLFGADPGQAVQNVSQICRSSANVRTRVGRFQVFMPQIFCLSPFCSPFCSLSQTLNFGAPFQKIIFFHKKTHEKIYYFLKIDKISSLRETVFLKMKVFVAQRRNVKTASQLPNSCQGAQLLRFTVNIFKYISPTLQIEKRLPNHFSPIFG